MSDEPRLKPGTLVMATREFEDWPADEGAPPKIGDTALVMGPDPEYNNRCYKLLHMDGRQISWWRAWFYVERNFEGSLGHNPIWKIVKEP